MVLAQLPAAVANVVVPVRERVLRASVTVSGPCEASCRGTVIGGGAIIGRRDDGSLVIVTAAHLTRSVTKLRVTLYDGTVANTEPAPQHSATIWRSAELLATSRASDIALLVVAPAPKNSIAVAPFALETAAQSGSIVGAPYGRRSSVSPYRYVSVNSEDSFLVDCATCGPGDSGGGAFDGHGRLAGILVSEQRIIERGEPTALAQRTARFRVIAVNAIRSLWLASRLVSAPEPLPAAIDPWSRF